jgi:hypothetical protein
MRVANTAIKRTRHPIPTLESVSMENLTCAKHTTSLNLVLNHEISQLFALILDSFAITTINYGTNAAAKLFQHTLQQILQDIKGIKNIADDSATVEQNMTAL